MDSGLQVTPSCPIVVFTALNVSPSSLRGFACHRCGDDLADHGVSATGLVPLSKAYAVDLDAVSEEVEFNG